MKAIKYIAIAMSLFGAVSAQAAIIPAGGFGVNSNFIDNGLITTEYRADGTVWEWLDLTVTNGISFYSLVDDLNDDNTLNNSNASTLNANAGAQADVAALTSKQAIGWTTMRALDVVAMFNSFFGTTLYVGQDLQAPSPPLYNTMYVETFIQMFGDTYHEALLTDTGLAFTDANPMLENIGYTGGNTSTYVHPLHYPGGLYTPTVFDGQYIHDTSDRYVDYIMTSEQNNFYSPSWFYGTWLKREVSVVSAPTSVVMYTLVLMGLIVCRRRS